MQVPFLGNRKSLDDATELMRAFGVHAGTEAASRADKSRDLGNHINFCHWRQIERMIFLLSMQQPVGTIH
jgi:hypothetical protein